jgi:5'-methylthioadenosine phosphorylase
METVGIIATYNITEFLTSTEERIVPTPWGEAHYYIGELFGRPVALLQRYGYGMEMVQHLVNFKANLWGFRQLGVRRVLSTDGVGSLRRDYAPASFVVVDDFIDFTKKGSLSFFEEHGCSVRVDLATPFCPELRAALVHGARNMSSEVHESGVVAAAEGPRFETPAEINMYRI